MKKMADVLDVIDQSTAKVMLYKHKKCSGCGSCNKHMHPGSVVDAFNPVGAQKGDMVDVNVVKKFSFIEFLVGYVLPVASFFAGLLLGGMLFSGVNGGGFTVVLAFFLLAVSIAVNVRYRRSFKPEYSVTITKRVAPVEPRL